VTETVPETVTETDRRHALALRIATEAGSLALDHWRRRDALAVEVKANRQDMVSEADRGVERAIRAAVAAECPEDGFLGEEYGLTDGASGYTWVIDPIDGTAPFLAGQPNWCVALAIRRGGRTVSGVIAMPVTEEIFAAQAGRGATLNGAPLVTPHGLGLQDGMVGVGASHRTAPEVVATVITGLLQRGGMFFRNGTGAGMLAYVAAGRLIGYYEPHMHAWDCLGGLLIVEEAGGRAAPFCPDGAITRGDRVLAAGPQAWAELALVVGER
jgi:myo-inositol-1(or 4)-monophosphatase